MTAPVRFEQDDTTELRIGYDLPFDEIARILPGAVVIMDHAMQIVYVDSSAAGMLGYTSDEMIGQSLPRFFSQQPASPYPDGMPGEENVSRFVHEQVVQGLHRDGQVIYINVSVNRYQLKDQKYFIYVIWDNQHYLAQQKELIESQQRYWGMIESQNALVVRLNHRGHFTFVNQSCCRMFGRSAEDLIGTSINDLVHPDDALALREASRGLRVSPYRIKIEVRLATVTGWRWIAWEGFALNPHETQAVGRDITERKINEEIAHIERNLAIILAQKSTLSEALPLCLDLALQVLDMDSGGIYLTDPKSDDLILMNHKGLSRPFIEKTEYVPKGSPRHQLAMRGMPIYQSYSQLRESKNFAALDEGIRSFASIPIFFNGQVTACLNIASHVNDDTPVFRRVALESLALQLGNMIARFQVQDELVESQQQLQGMFDSLMDFVFVLDMEGRIIQVNQMVLNRLGYQREELIGHGVLEVHPPEYRETAWKIIEDMLAGVLDTCPLDLLAKDGSYIPVETKVAPGRWGKQDVLIGVSRDISERKRSEALIFEKTREIEDFFSLSVELLCIADLQGNFIRVNKAWEQVLGYSMGELQKRKFLDFVHPEDMQATLDKVAQLADGNTVINFVNRFQRKDGSWRYIEWHSQPHGSLIYAAANDITEWKIAEDMRNKQTNLLAYRNRFEEILTSISTQFINLPSLEIDLQITDALKRIGEFEKVDRSYVFLFDNQASITSNTHEWCAPGIEPQIDNLQNVPYDVIPWWMEKILKLEDVYIPDVSQLPTEANTEKEILEAQSIQSVLVIPLAINNNPIGFLGFDSVTHQRDWSPESILLIKMVGDILSNALVRRKMENDLRQSEAQNRALVSAIPDLIFRLRPDGIILNYKVSSNELLAIPGEQLIGSSIYDILDEPFEAEARNCIRLALESGQVQSMEYSLNVKATNHIFEARFINGGSDDVIAIVRDVSEKARLEQMKSDFINRATHELRTPIATMLLMTNLIDGTTDRKEFAEYWNVLKSELNRERLLVENLLTVGRLESGQSRFNFRSIEVEPLLKYVVESLELSAKEKNISVELDLGSLLNSPPRLVHADETALTQVFVNLVGNAIKYTPMSGKVIIRARKDGAGVIVSVTDTGIGISNEDLPLLFNRFFRGSNAIKEEIQGTGIGLFIVRSILEKHGGKIQIASELGSGSQFDVWLPLEASS